MRSIKKIHSSIYAPIDDLETYRPMPTHGLNHLDPFLFLNHHGPQIYGPDNNGLPFGPHPHRGFETLTFVLKGDLVHWDSSGSKSKIESGGIQWMTAGSGLIHSEISSEEFKANGGEEEVIQLWLNLPSHLKMIDPSYVGLPESKLTHLPADDEKVIVHLVSGKMLDAKGPVDSLTKLTMASINFRHSGKLVLDIPEDHQILFYVVNGLIKVNDQTAKTHELVEFNFGDSYLEIEALEDSCLLFGHGKPFNEPIVAQGPFVMNSLQEIHEAFSDYQSGKMGSW